MSAAWLAQLRLLPDYLGQHLLLTLAALGAGIALSVPLAILVGRVHALRAPVLALASIVQTIPGLALLALMVPLLRQIGFLPAVLALILYSVLPILRNTVTGIEQVDADLVEAGRGLGMTDRQLLFKVQLPLALPVIVAGVRTATVWVVGMATLSTPVGATSLGNYIFSGLQTQNHVAVLVGCLAAATLALVLDRIVGLFEHALFPRNGRLLAVAAALLALVVAGAAVPALRLAAGGGLPRVVIGTKTFTEQYVLGELLAERMRAAGFDVTLRGSLGSTVAFNALVSGALDVYVDYTGTIWANYMKRTSNPGRAQILAGVSDWLETEHGVQIAAALGFENAYALAMRREQAATLRIASIADLAAHAPRLRIGGDYEFFDRPEWADVARRYGLSFRERVAMDSTLMYAALREGEVDVVSAFSTDGRIPAFDLVLLADPLEALPPYDAVVLVGPRAASLANLRETLRPLTGAISASAMQNANRAVDIDGEDVAAAARRLAQSIELTAPLR
jgi:osmoprotectant transport system permease protein